MTSGISSLRRVSAAVVLILCITAVRAQSRSTEADLKARLLGKTFFLKGFWRDDKLKFDSAGSLIGKSAVASFTVSGIEIETVELDRRKVVLGGRRVGLKFEKDAPVRLLLTQNPDQQEDVPVKLEIAAPARGDYRAVLDAIFADNLAVLVPLLPDAWQTYAKKNFIPAASNANSATDAPADTGAVADRSAPSTALRKIGGAVKPPVVLHRVEPVITPEALQARLNNSTLIRLIVEADGSVVHPEIVLPAGLGLDEAAVAAIQQYRFQPAVEGEKPVPVEVSIKVNFQVY